MKERVVFGGTDFPGPFKIYSIIKRERGPKSLLTPPRKFPAAADFSWPPKKAFGKVSDSARDEGDKS
ncbi:MAG: hypothetical protein J6V90_01075 [Treponema sp.]|nr:hypothetical protein [Treponema sp.]